MPPKSSPSLDPMLLADAMGAAVGAAMVLDENLRIELCTPQAEELLGSAVRLHESAPKILCGSGPKRPVAEALAEGRSIEALIPRPSESGRDLLLRVRSMPLRPDAGKVHGWLLLLEDAGVSQTEPVNFHGMWTRSLRMREVFKIVERAAVDDVTVLVRGETGTGKELVAQAIHDLSRRHDGPFQALNCAALPANLLESELFGHMRGAFTGAVRDTPGHFQRAHRGTLFLDEIAELPLSLQAKLLRVLETQSVIPVGGRDPVAIDVRIVAATHRALRKEVEAGHFRADLMYRLRIIPIFLPALRERKEDIGLLCEKFCEQMNQTARRKIESISPGALLQLQKHDWPGNIRELRNALAYAYTIGEGPTLRASELPPEIVDPELGGAAAIVAPVPTLPAGLDSESQRILAVLERTGGNRNRAAKILGMSRVTLWRRLKALGLEEDGTSGPFPAR